MVFDATSMILQYGAVLMIATRRSSVRRMGAVLLPVSLWLTVLAGENIAFCAIGWILNLGFAVILAALMRTALQAFRTRTGENTARRR